MEEDPLVSRLKLKFERDVFDLVVNDTLTCAYKLRERGQLSTALRKVLSQLAATADLQLEAPVITRMLLGFASQLQQNNADNLALDVYDMALSRCDGISDEVTCVTCKVEAIHNSIIITSGEILNDEYSYVAPMVISKLMRCLQQLRYSISLVFELPSRLHEELSWLVMNGCKLILQTAQPLIWKSTGKYVAETLLFAAVSVESIINLCTVKHLTFRCKLYATTFYAIVAGNGSIEEGQRLLEHASKEVQLLREREELDLPMPDAHEAPLVCAEVDLAVMTFALAFWKDPDACSLDANELAKLFPGRDLVEKCERFLLSKTKGSSSSAYSFISFSNRCVNECIRIQQMTCGNSNEVWKKRSSAILKAFWKVYESNTEPLIKGGVNAEVGELFFSSDCLTSVAIVAMFDPTDGAPSDVLLQKVFSLLDAVDGDETAPGVLAELSLLHKLHRFASLPSAESDAKRLESMTALLQSIGALMNSDIGSRRKSLLRRVAMGVWSKYVYGALQSLLGQDRAVLTRDPLLLEQLRPALFSLSQVLALSQLEDPVLYGSVVAVAARILGLSGEHRGAISLLRRALDQVDDNRASRVDARLHEPDDVRDLFALQRQSFTTRAEAADWFHSEKRLGSNAFAGYGIFGAGSTADRTDQALAEIQVDLYALYFRLELEYALAQRNARQLAKSLVRRKEKAAERAKTAKVGSSDATKGATAGGATISGAESWAALGTEDSLSASLDNLSVISTLRTYCGKNGYAKCVLLLEMARLEIDDERKALFLKEARQCILDAEASEQRLKDAFADLIVMTASKPRYPLVLARSHRFVYLCPVGCRKFSQATYYRVLAKEQGSGTDISLSNDDMAGCDQRVPVQSLVAPRACFVGIECLRAGERYVFGSAAFAADDMPIPGGVSPTSPPVEAVNPLPTILLWSCYAQAALSLGFHPLSSGAARRVCSRFFLEPPTHDPIVVGKGINLFVDSEPCLCELAVQQSSILLLSEFVKSFLILEGLQQLSDEAEAVHWTFRRETQISVLRSLRRSAVVAVVAAYIGSQELAVQCVCLAYKFACVLLEFDSVLLAQYLQAPVTVLISVLQTVPKSNWKALEHKLYARLYLHFVRLCVMNRNTAPAIELMPEVLPELLDGEVSGAVSATITEGMQSEYFSLLSVTRVCGRGVIDGPALLSQLRALLSPAFPTDAPSDYLWTLPAPQRGFIVQSRAVELLAATDKSTPELLLLDRLARAPAPQYSAFLQLLVDLLAGEPGDARALTLYPVYVDYLAPAVRELCVQWRPFFIGTLPPAPPMAAEEGVEPPVLEPVTEVESAEVDRQFSGLATLAVRLATVLFRGIGSARNYFPSSEAGPLLLIDPYDPNACLRDEQLLPAGPTEVAAKDDEAATAAPAILPAKLDREQFLDTMLLAVSMYSRGGHTFSAVSTLSALWDALVDGWIDPRDFAARRSKTLHLHFSGSVDNLLLALETFACVGASFNGADVLDGSPAAQVPSRRLAKEQLVCCRDFLVWAVKVLWLGKAYDQVVLLGTRVLRMYNELSPELCKAVMGSCLPLMLHASDCLIDHAFQAVALREGERDKFVEEFEEYLKKKRRKKLRVVRVEKDEDDVRFDAEKKAWQVKIDAEQELLAGHEDRKSQILQQREFYESTLSAGYVLLNRVRSARKVLLLDCKDSIMNRRKNAAIDGALDESPVDVRECADSIEFSGRIDDLVAQYKKVGNLLRETQECVPLFEGQKELGDLLLVLGRTLEARQSFHDAVDGLFNTMDAHKHWRDVVANLASQKQSENSSTFVGGLVPAACVLGKASLYCATGDYDSKYNYCKLAAGAVRHVFRESCGHPLTDVGFASYVCRDLGGTGALIADMESMAPNDVAVGIGEVLDVLMAEGDLLAALPVVVMLEYFHSACSRHLPRWLSARMIRVRLLIGLKLFAEAASMLAGIKATVQAISQGAFCDALKQPYGPTALVKTIADFDTSAAGLDFYGFAAFFNNLPPHHENNKAALEWIGSFSSDFKVFSAAFVKVLPVKELTADELAAKEEAARVLAEEAAKEAAKSKGKKPASVAVVEPPREEGPPTKSLFGPASISELTIECARLLVTVSSTELRASAAVAPQLQEYTKKAEAAVSEVLASLGDEAKARPVLQDAQWLRLFGQCQLLRARLLINRRQLLPARAVLNSTLRTMQNPSLGGSLAGGCKAALTHLWLSVKEMSAEVAEKQARFEDCIGLATSGAKEASNILSGSWLRTFLLARASTSFKLGRIPEAEADCRSVAEQFEERGVYTTSYVRCLLLLSSIVKEQGLYESKEIYADQLYKSIEYMRKAKKAASQLAEEAGFRGTESNFTFDVAESMVMSHQILPASLNSLTTFRTNEPDLTLYARPEAKKGSAQESSEEEKLSFPPAMRFGPVDEAEGVYSKSVYANIYLGGARLLLTCLATLSMTLDDVRASGVRHSKLQPDKVLHEQVDAGESGLRLLRHCVYAPPYLRLQLLLSIGKTRAACMRAQPAANADASFFLQPLQVALQLAVSSGAHDWQLMKSTCIQLLESYADPSLEAIGLHDDGLNLRRAACYLLSGSKLSNQLDVIQVDPLGRLVFIDKAMDLGPPEIVQLLEAVTSSSATKQKETKASRRTANSLPKPEDLVMPEKDPKKAAAAKDKKASEPEETPLQINGRDAVFLLASLLREVNPFLLDSYERELQLDLHAAMKKAYPIYAAKCALAVAPDPNAVLTVPKNSVSTLWALSRTPLSDENMEYVDHDIGHYTHMTVYFLLGATEVAPSVLEAPAAAKGGKAAPVAAAVNSNEVEPVLAKLLLYRPSARAVEDMFRDILYQIEDFRKKDSCELIHKEEIEPAMLAYGHDFLKAIEAMVTLFRRGHLVDDEETEGIKVGLKGRVEKGVGDASAIVFVTISGGEIKLPMTDALLTRMAEAVGCDADLDCCVSYEMCTVVSQLLGY